jgi:hypothetical protein
MIYLDAAARLSLKRDLDRFYAAALGSGSNLDHH